MGIIMQHHRAAMSYPLLFFYLFYVVVQKLIEAEYEGKTTFGCTTVPHLK